MSQRVGSPVCGEKTYDDVNGAAAVVLDNFVRSLVGATANDPCLITTFIILDTNSVLADCDRVSQTPQRLMRFTDHPRTRRILAYKLHRNVRPQPDSSR